jgi:triosephosphate isomerase
VSDRTPVLSANWKMNKTIEETERFLAEFLPRVTRTDAEVVICPPYPSLKAAVEHCAQSRVRVAAQNMHEAESGAFTGEVSAPMLLELGVDGVILGHSERREYFAETDEALARKVPAALAAGLRPILCIGEREEEREAGDTDEVLRRQIDTDLAEVDDERLGDVLIAYEPIWAIGTGRTATPEQAQEAIELIRERIAARSADAAARLRILYGGSVKPENAAELLAQADIDGALVGGASLDPGDFAAIVAAAG